MGQLLNLVPILSFTTEESRAKNCKNVCTKAHIISVEIHALTTIWLQVYWFLDLEGLCEIEPISVTILKAGPKSPMHLIFSLMLLYNVHKSVPSYLLLCSPNWPMFGDVMGRVTRSDSNQAKGVLLSVFTYIFSVSKKKHIFIVLWRFQNNIWKWIIQVSNIHNINMFFKLSSCR